MFWLRAAIVPARSSFLITSSRSVGIHDLPTVVVNTETVDPQLGIRCRGHPPPRFSFLERLAAMNASGGSSSIRTDPKFNRVRFLAFSVNGPSIAPYGRVHQSAPLMSPVASRSPQCTTYASMALATGSVCLSCYRQRIPGGLAADSVFSSSRYRSSFLSKTKIANREHRWRFKWLFVAPRIRAV